MIKSIISTEKPKNIYPCLKQSKSHPNMIILFIKPQTGIVLSKDSDSFFNIGDYSDTWIEKNFDIIKRSITLSND